MKRRRSDRENNRKREDKKITFGNIQCEKRKTKEEKNKKKRKK